jgi:hypothetical protein
MPTLSISLFVSLEDLYEAAEEAQRSDQYATEDAS